MTPEPDEANANGRTWLVLIAFGAAVAVAALVGSLSTIDASDQYAELEQPSWAPPGWLFGPVWTTLYIMIAVSGWLAWRQSGLKHPAMALYGVQLTMNMLWSPLFFAWQLRGLALAWIIVLDVVLLLTILRFRALDRRASWLLVPYQAWVLFATALNAGVWWLNR